MLMLASFNVLLNRWSGASDILVGTPTANRLHAEFEPLIGLFVNTIVLRTDLSGNPSFREVLARVRKMALQAYAHQDLPFEKLVEALHVERSLRYTPLIQVLFTFFNLPSASLPMDKIRWEVLDIERDISPFDLHLLLNENKEGLRATLEYNSDLFDAATITRFLGHWRTLLQSLARHLDQPVATLPLLTDEELRSLEQWNATDMAVPTELCLHQLIERQVASTPEDVAAICAGQQITYKQLNYRANQLAAFLRKAGVGPDHLVGVCMERSLDLLSVLLAVLKAGGAYVPLDPGYPSARLHWMIEDARLDLLLTDSSLPLADLAASCQVINISEKAHLWEKESGDNHPGVVSAQNLAYVIYTSGSTGRPKGVQIPHAAVVNLLSSIQRYPGIRPQDRLLAVTPISFDIAALELFLPLSVGARVILASREVARDGEQLAQMLQEQEITLMQATPTTWQMLLLSRWRGKADLKVLCGGEAFPVDLANRLVQGCASVWNMYGPTETTIWSTCEQVQEGVPISLGRPIANTRVYILDAYGQQVPAGVVGEICLGGAGVARGYWKRPELTAERFVPDPWSRTPEARLYRTGDLGRYRADGRLEYLGRVDQQVKLRGFRIELGEIEVVLQQHPAVSSAVVVLQRQEQVLIAYVVLDSVQTISSEQLREHLALMVPSYMLPAAIVILEALPLTPNGKIDRQELAARSLMASHPVSAQEAPCTPLEEVLVQIWQQVLHVPAIGVTDNFFDLGGNSFSLVLVADRIRRQTEFSVSLKKLFEYQTIAELAAQLVSTPRQVQEPPVVGPLPLLPAQHWFFEYGFKPPYRWLLASLWEVLVPVRLALLEEAFQTVIRVHDQLRARFLLTSEGWQQIISDPGEQKPLLIKQIDLTKVPVDEQEEAVQKAIAHMQTDIDIIDGPLLRVGLLRLGGNRPDRICVLLHHLVGDARSYQIVLEDVLAVYQQLSQGETAQVPARTASVQQWMEHLTAYAASQRLREEFDFWQSLPWDEISPLPVDFPEKLHENTRQERVKLHMTFTAEETRDLLQTVSTTYHVQFHHILQAALTLTLARWTGSYTCLLGMSNHGREPLFDDIEILRTVGWFAVNQCPVLLQVPAHASYREVLATVREQADRIPHQGLGYDVLHYLTKDQEIQQKIRALPRPEVVIWYVPDNETTVSEVAPLLRPAHVAVEGQQLDVLVGDLLNVHPTFQNGCLHITWEYSQKVYRRETVQQLAAWLAEEVRGMVASCAPATPGDTQSSGPDSVAPLQQGIHDL